MKPIALLFALLVPAAQAQDYPSRPIRLVIPYGPGSLADAVPRLIQPALEQKLGQRIVIEHRPGAGGNVGTQAVVSAPPDGYTLVMTATNNLVINQFVFKDMKFDPLADLAPVSLIAEVPLILQVHPSLPANLKEFIEQARANPGKINYGSPSTGTIPHLAMEIFARAANLKLTHVPFKGGAPASASLAAGEIQLILTPVSEVLPHIQANRVRPIAVSSDKRITQMPDIPAIGETVKGYEFTSWFGAFAPTGTPRPIVDRLNAEIQKALGEPTVLSNLTAQALDPMYLTSEEFAKKLKAEYDKYEKVVKVSGARLD